MLCVDDNYQPTQMSPTMQLATQMGASAHKVQLMKATFYTDELDDYHISKYGPVQFDKSSEKMLKFGTRLKIFYCVSE